MMNTQKIVAVLFLSMVIFGCESESNSGDMDEIDEVPPSINLTGIDTSLEELTAVTINISDSSPAVTTKVSINNDQVLETTEKQFTYEIDPFSFPTGTTTLTIRAEDENNNKAEVNRTFELSKLLVKIADNVSRTNPEFVEVFYAVNTMDGELLGYTDAVNRWDTVKIYAPDNFMVQPIILTSYMLSSAVGPAFVATSFSNIVPGTDFFPFQENAGKRTANNAAAFDSNVGLNASFNFSITGIPFEPEAWEFRGFGSRYGVISNPTVTPNGTDFDYSVTFGYRSESPQDVVITNGSFANLNELVDLEYFEIQALENQSISYKDLKKTENFIAIQIPETIARGSTLRLDGIKENNNSPYDDFSHLLTTGFEANTSPNNVFNLSIPQINGFDAIRLTAGLNLADNGKKLISSTIGIEDIVVPSWDASLMGNEVTATGDFDLISIETQSDLNNFVLEESFRWTYFTPKQNAIAIPFSLIEIPEPILQNPKFPNVEQSAMSTTGDLTITLESFSEKPSYEQSLFRNEYEQGRKGNEVSLRIPLQN